jgi:hypothetical protein
MKRQRVLPKMILKPTQFLSELKLEKLPKNLLGYHS